MIADEELWNKLYQAAETVYKYMDPDRGFFSGIRKNDDQSLTKIYNRFDGAVPRIESKLGRKLRVEEQVVLAIAVGDRNQKCLKKILSDQEIDEIFTDLWDNKPNKEHVCLTFDRLLTCI